MLALECVLLLNMHFLQQIAEASRIIDSDNFTPPTGIYDISNVCQATTAFTQDVFPPMQARCNMDSNDGGWTVLIRRTPDVDKRENFNREWADYEKGFGNLTGEFWYGLKNMHCLTSREQMEVEIEMRKTDGTKAFLSYGNFKIDGSSTSYTLHVSDKQHEGADELGHHNGMKFSTTDRDNDRHSLNCATTWNGGGWWFNRCYAIHLTDSINPRLTGTSIVYHYAELRVRPKACSALRKIKSCRE